MVAQSRFFLTLGPFVIGLILEYRLPFMVLLPGRIQKRAFHLIHVSPMVSLVFEAARTRASRLRIWSIIPVTCNQQAFACVFPWNGLKASFFFFFF